MVAQLQQYGGHIGLADLAQRGGGTGIDLVRQRIDVFQIFHKNIRRAAAISTGGIVKSDDTADGALLGTIGTAVGVKRQIKIVTSRICQADGAGGGHVGGVAGKTDGVGQKIGLHGIGDQVHKVLF